MRFADCQDGRGSRGRGTRIAEFTDLVSTFCRCTGNFNIHAECAADAACDHTRRHSGEVLPALGRPAYSAKRTILLHERYTCPTRDEERVLPLHAHHDLSARRGRTDLRLAAGWSRMNPALSAFKGAGWKLLLIPNSD